MEGHADSRRADGRAFARDPRSARKASLSSTVWDARGEAMAVKPIPEGYRTFTPYYVVEGAAEFIEFLKKAFGAEETLRMPAPGGRIGHAEVRIGDSMVMLADQSGAEHPARQMSALLYVTDSDAVFKKAVAAGAKGVRPPENM